MAVKHRDDDTDVMERDEHMRANVPAKRNEGVPGPQQQAGIEAFVVMSAGDPLTVTHQNPTPPTNYSYNSYGTPPTPPAQPFVDDGVGGATTAIAAPLSSIAGPSGTIAEATGTVVIDTEANGTTSITVQGAYTNTPNASHPSANAPATAPTVTGLVPQSTSASGGTMDLTVNGTGFEPQSQVLIAGVPNATVFRSSTQLSAINAPKRTTAGTSLVTVSTGGVAVGSGAPATWTFV